jgi:hypothetical protein
LIRAVTGTRDILPAEVSAWHRIEAAAHSLFARYGYREIRTPIFEETQLFARGIVDTADLDAAFDEEVHAPQVLIAPLADNINGFPALEFAQLQQSREPVQRFAVDGLEDVESTQVPKAEVFERLGCGYGPGFLDHVLDVRQPPRVEKN